MLKGEITRIASRQARAETEGIRKGAASQRRDIAALKREVAGLRREIAGMRRQLRSMLDTTAPAARRQPRAAASDDDHQAVQRRFRRGGLVAHRKKLGLSAEDYGKLAGVTGQTIYKWEQGTRPRAAQLEALAKVRGIGKREALQRLEQMNDRPASARAKAR